MVIASSIFFLSSGVIFSCSSIDFITASFLAASSFKRSYSSLICISCTSSRLPVISFLYLLIKGIVAPPSINLIVFSTCHSWSPSFFATSNIFLFVSMILLFNINNQTFQIFAFRVIDIYRMIRRLTHLMQYSDIASGIGSRSKDRYSEIFFCHNLGTGECENNSTRLYLFNCLYIQPFISLQCICQNIIMFRKCRRIEYYQVVLIFYMIHIIKCINLCLLY